MTTALELLTIAQVSINASGITEAVSAFCRKFFAGLHYTEDASTHMFTLHCLDGGYYFRVDFDLESISTQWDVSKNGQWIGLDAKEFWLFKESDARKIIEGITEEFTKMTEQCFVVQPELQPTKA